jgi:hypothetical protein
MLLAGPSDVDALAGVDRSGQPLRPGNGAATCSSSRYSAGLEGPSSRTLAGGRAGQSSSTGQERVDLPAAGE